MIILKRVLFYLLIICPLISLAQIRGRSGSQDSEAGDLYKQAEKLWKKEQFQEAEKLYFKANAIAPNMIQMNELA